MSVSRAIAAAGNPIPKKPFTIPDKKNVTNMNDRILRSLDGKKYSGKLISNLSPNST
tara:strand:- start:945 stop:1115 length:171 start_codon:yes stop_codon:yes gene_type:complete